jgi:putative ATPase
MRASRSTRSKPQLRARANATPTRRASPLPTWRRRSSTHVLYDRAGDPYDTVSAFIKTIRGSDPDGALYWLARMIESGEDPLFIIRRMVILASEDVGLADPQALVVATACQQAVHFVGMPEGFYAMAECALYLALAPKANTSTAYAALRRRGHAQRPVRCTCGTQSPA